MHKDILQKNRQQNEFSQIKLLTKEDVIFSYLGLPKKEAIPFLIEKENLSYESAKEYLRFVPYCKESNNPKIHKLYSYKKELIDNHLYESDFYFYKLFENAEVDVIGYSSNDEELINVLKKLKSSPNFIKSEEIHLKESYCVRYRNIEDETLYVLNQIADLIKSGVSSEDIFILTNPDYYSFIRRFEDGFNLKFNLKERVSLYTQEVTVAFIKAYKESQNLDEEIEKLQNLENRSEIEELLLETLQNGKVNNLSFDKQFEYIKGLLKDTILSNPIYRPAISLISQPIYRENIHIFVLGFRQNVFPSSYKDNEYLLDEDKKQLGINTTLINSECDYDLWLQFFKSNNHFYYSFSEYTAGEKSYISPLAKSLLIEEKAPTFPKTIYSKEMGRIIFDKQVDIKKDFLIETSEYKALSDYYIAQNEYDNTFKPFDIPHDEKRKYSYSALDKYYACPFYYYLLYVLNLKDDSDTFNMKFGNLAHRVFEDVFKHLDKDKIVKIGIDYMIVREDNFARKEILKVIDFEDIYGDAVFLQEWSPRDKVLLKGLKGAVEQATLAGILHMTSYMVNGRSAIEEYLENQLTEDVKIYGYIDKIYIVDERYLLLIDYKTGNTKFEPKKIENGRGMQLPFYALLCEGDTNFKNYKVQGFYYNNILTSYKDKLESNGLIPKYLELHGITLDDPEAKQYIDTTLENPPAKGAHFIKPDFKNNCDFNGYIDTVEQKVLEADKNILNNQFEIHPYYEEEKSPFSHGACTYCPFADVCFVKDEQINIVKKNDGEEEK